MKNTNHNNIRFIFLMLSIVLILFYTVDFRAESLFFTETQTTSNIEGDIANQYSGNTFIYTHNGKNYLAEYITKEKVEDMKKDVNIEVSREYRDLVIDGHGTGYLAPSEEDLEALIGKISVIELNSDSHQRYMATADISTEMYFPTVGDQGSQGSCTSWANVYYAYGYLEAKDYGWDASSGNPQYLLSPAWSYNKIAAYDYGSVPSETAQLIKEWGVSTLSTMPYDDLDVDSWGDEAAWREAPYHKPLDYTLITYGGYPTIDAIKSLLDSGTPVTFGIDAYQLLYGLNKSSSDFILSSDDYDPSGVLNHANCFVGYDDSISDGSDVGAFRVVNSWGESWMDNGFYWLTYDAFNEFGAAGGQQILFLTDRIDYNPNIIAFWEFSTAPTRMGDIISLGVGPHNSPIDILIPHYDYDVNNLFPEFMAFDLTDFYSYYTINNDVFFYLEIGLAGTTGTISSFKLERYASGILQEISQESPDTPKNTPGYVNATFMIFAHEIKVMLKTPSDPVIHNSYQIKSLIMNNGANTETSVNFYLWLNGIPVDSRIIANIPSGTTVIIKYSWTPTVYDVYNFTAYVTPVPGETYRSNNKDTKIFNVLGPIFFDDFENGLSKWVSISGMWHLTGKNSAWPDPYHSPTHSMWFGNESTGDYDTGFREMGNLTSTFIDLTTTTAAFLEFYHWREAEGYGYDESLVYISTDGVNWNLINENGGTYTAPWEKVSVDISAYVGNPSVQLQFTFDTYDHLYNNYRGWLIDDVVVRGTGVVIPHELRVSLDVPETVEIHNTYLINATVTNIGTSDESNVDLFLYRDSVIIDSLNLASLLSGSTQTINYLWTPTTYGDFNFTAYAPPIPGEMLRFNNYVSEILPLHKINLFDGMYINYTMSVYEISNYTGPLQVSYTQISEFKFRVLMEGNLSGIQVLSTWDVDTQTRLTENYIGTLNFGGVVFHTPFWIFTDVSITDEIEIGVIVDNDHIFIVSGETTLNIPEFGSLEVWVLEDLTLPGGTAYYEKSTGILVNGIFFYLEGLYNYTLSFLYTNVKFGKVKNGVPGYNIIFFGTTIGFLSLIVALRKRKKFT